MIQEELKHMTVVITGGSKGIGAGIARAFCSYGAHTVIASRDEDAGKRLADMLSAETSGTCVFYKCDVADESQVKSMVDSAVSRLGHLDCMINNAGYMPCRCPIDEMSILDMTQVMKVNLGGVLAGTKAALPYLRSTHGCVINISSVLGHSGQEGNALYAASKAAITAFTKSIACDEARNNVRVNVLSPGDIRSNIDVNQSANVMRRIKQDSLSKIHWLNRQGEPEDIGMACLFLASSWASFITGSEMFVDGGFFAGHGFKQQSFDWKDIMQIKSL